MLLLRILQLTKARTHVGKVGVKFGKPEEFIMEMARFPDFKLPRYANRLRVGLITLHLSIYPSLSHTHSHTHAHMHACILEWVWKPCVTASVC